MFFFRRWAKKAVTTRLLPGRSIRGRAKPEVNVTNAVKPLRFSQNQFPAGSDNQSVVEGGEHNCMYHNQLHSINY